MLHSIPRWLAAQSLGRLISVGFILSVLTVTFLAIYSVRAIGILNDAVSTFSRTADVTAALNADMEHVFEARIAAAAYLASGDATYAGIVLEKIDSVVRSSPLLAIAGLDASVAARAEEMRAELSAYRDAFEQVRGLVMQFDDQVARLMQDADTVRQASSDLRQVAFAEFEVDTARELSSAIESLLTAQAHLADFRASRTPAAFSAAANHFGLAGGALQTLNDRAEARG